MMPRNWSAQTLQVVYLHRPRFTFIFQKILTRNAVANWLLLLYALWLWALTFFWPSPVRSFWRQFLPLFKLLHSNTDTWCDNLNGGIPGSVVYLTSVVYWISDAIWNRSMFFIHFVPHSHYLCEVSRHLKLRKSRGRLQTYNIRTFDGFKFGSGSSSNKVSNEWLDILWEDNRTNNKECPNQLLKSKRTTSLQELLIKTSVKLGWSLWCRGRSLVKNKLLFYLRISQLSRPAPYFSRSQNLVKIDKWWQVSVPKQNNKLSSSISRSLKYPVLGHFTLLCRGRLRNIQRSFRTHVYSHWHSCTVYRKLHSIRLQELFENNNEILCAKQASRSIVCWCTWCAIKRSSFQFTNPEQLYTETRQFHPSLPARPLWLRYRSQFVSVTFLHRPIRRQLTRWFHCIADSFVWYHPENKTSFSILNIVNLNQLYRNFNQSAGR